MATIKSYTDLSQSKKLAEILPLESANVCYRILPGIKEGMPAQYIAIVPDDAFFESDIPAWSLAALLNILPRFIEFKGDKYYLRFMKEYIEYANDEISITGRCLHTTGNDNLVDACVEMIIKLNEMGLL